jgi:hypothetical protein
MRNGNLRVPVDGRKNLCREPAVRTDSPAHLFSHQLNVQSGTQDVSIETSAIMVRIASQTRGASLVPVGIRTGSRPLPRSSCSDGSITIPEVAPAIYAVREMARVQLCHVRAANRSRVDGTHRWRRSVSRRVPRWACTRHDSSRAPTHSSTTSAIVLALPEEAAVDRQDRPHRQCPHRSSQTSPSTRRQ